MSKPKITLRLFLAACCAVLLKEPPLNGTQRVGAPVSQAAPTSRNVRGLIKGGASRHGEPGISLLGAEPIFHSLDLLFPRVEDYVFEDVTQRLDGLDCTNCTFKDVTLEYAGGNFNLVNATFSGRTRLMLKGAAANTASAVSMLAAIGSGNVSAPPAPNQPVVKSTLAKQSVTLNWKNPYSGVPSGETSRGAKP